MAPKIIFFAHERIQGIKLTRFTNFHKNITGVDLSEFWIYVHTARIKRIRISNLLILYTVVGQKVTQMCSAHKLKNVSLFGRFFRRRFFDGNLTKNKEFREHP